MNGWSGPVAVGLLAVAVVVLGALLVRAHGRLSRLEERLAAGPEAPAAQPAEAVRAPVQNEDAFLITHIDDPEPAAAPARIDGRLFADLVARESVVRAAGVAAGLRRALAPETRNRIRFTMRQQVKAARKRRRAGERTARRMSQRGEAA